MKSIFGLLAAIFLTFCLLFILNKIVALESQTNKITADYTQLQSDYLDVLYADHLHAMEAVKLEEEKWELASSHSTFTSRGYAAPRAVKANVLLQGPHSPLESIARTCQ